MSTETIPYTPLVSPRGRSWIERYTLRRFHPVSIFFDFVGVTWFVFFLWQHNWQAAIAVAVAERIAAALIVRNADVEALAGTMLGKLGLLHLHPVNATIQILGAVTAAYGVWQHGGLVILAGLSLVFLGHTFGWPKVDRAFTLGH